MIGLCIIVQIYGTGESKEQNGFIESSCFDSKVTFIIVYVLLFLKIRFFLSTHLRILLMLLKS